MKTLSYIIASSSLFLSIFSHAEVAIKDCGNYSLKSESLVVLVDPLDRTVLSIGSVTLGAYFPIKNTQCHLTIDQSSRLLCNESIIGSVETIVQSDSPITKRLILNSNLNAEIAGTCGYPELILK